MKDQLAQLIEAYAAARPTANAMLQGYAARELNAFLEGVEITPAAAPAPTIITEDETNA